MPSAETPPSLGRQARAIRNDVAIIEAAVHLLADEGWAALALSRVAALAGLSERPVRDRFDTPAELAQAVWMQVAWPTLRDALDTVLAESSPQACAQGPGALASALERFARPDATMRTARELVLVARFQPGLQAVLAETLCGFLTGWLAPGPGKVSRTQAASRAIAIALALGLLLHADRPDASRIKLDQAIDPFVQALAAPGKASRLPAGRFAHLDEPAVVPTGDVGRDALLQAVLTQVGMHGYEGATTATIAKASGFTEGLLFGRYENKRALFLDATTNMIGHATELNTAEQLRLSSARSPSVAEAVMIREMMRPERRTLRTITLEQLRLASHDLAMRDAIEAAIALTVSQAWGEQLHVATKELRAQVHVGLALGNGPLVLADLVEQAWDLPFDVITVPLAQT